MLKLNVRARDGMLVPLSELVQVMPSARDKTIYHKDLLPVVLCVRRHGGKLDSPLYGMFGIRGNLKGMALAQGGKLPKPSSASRAIPTPASA